MLKLPYLQVLEGAKSLEEVTNAHSAFVVAVQRQCLLAPDKTWKLIEDVVIQILNQVLQIAELQQKLRKPVSQLLLFNTQLLLCIECFVVSHAGIAPVGQKQMITEFTT